MKTRRLISSAKRNCGQDVQKFRTTARGNLQGYRRRGGCARIRFLLLGIVAKKGVGKRGISPRKLHEEEDGGRDGGRVPKERESFSRGYRLNLVYGNEI